MRLINADEAVKIAERSFDMWNMAMATADTQREINLIFKRQELCKAVELVVKHCPTIDPVKHGCWIETEDYTVICSCCKAEAYYQDNSSWFDDFEDEDGDDGSGYVRFDYCPHCGAKMDGDVDDA